ncbi:MAG: T9SS type A sorting domain-containing protein [Bacteroidia bacterium]
MKKTRFPRFSIVGLCMALLLLTAVTAHAGGAFLDVHTLNLPSLDIHQVQTINFSAAPQLTPSLGEVVCNRATCAICNSGPQGGSAIQRSICSGHDLNVPHQCVNHPDHNPMANNDFGAKDFVQIDGITRPAPPAGWEYQQVLLANTKYDWRLVRVEDEEALPVVPTWPSDEQLALRNAVELRNDLNFNPIMAPETNLEEQNEIESPEAVNALPEVAVNAEPIHDLDEESPAAEIEELIGGLPEYEMNYVDKATEASGAESSAPLVREVSVWPNPSQGQFQVRMHNPLMTPVHFEVVNSAGQVVARKDSDEDASASFDLKGLSAGIYHVVAYSGRGQWSKEVLIRR